MEITWDLAEEWTVVQTPSVPPALFSGDRLLVYGVLKHSESGKAGQDEMSVNKARLRGSVDHDREKLDHTITFTVSGAKTADRPTDTRFCLHRLAAKSSIQEQQDEYNDCNEPLNEDKRNKTRDSIIDISKAANVVSKFTSFVAVDRDNHEPVSGPLRKRVVPQFGCMNLLLGSPSFRVSAGMASVDHYLIPMEKLKKKSRAGIFSKVKRSSAGTPQSMPKTISSMICRSGRNDFAGADGTMPPPPPPAAASYSSASHCAGASQPILELISLQKASGAWDLTDHLISLCGVKKAAAIRACPGKIPTGTSKGKQLWATALALALLMGSFASQKDEWEMIAEKGKKWMEKNLPASIKFPDALRTAANTVGVNIITEL